MNIDLIKKELGNFKLLLFNLFFCIIIPLGYILLQLSYFLLDEDYMRNAHHLRNADDMIKYVSSASIMLFLLLYIPSVIIFAISLFFKKILRRGIFFSIYIIAGLIIGSIIGSSINDYLHPEATTLLLLYIHISSILWGAISFYALCKIMYIDQHTTSEKNAK